MATIDELTEGTINKPKNTALHNRLEQKNLLAKSKAHHGFRSVTPQFDAVSSHFAKPGNSPANTRDLEKLVANAQMTARTHEQPRIRSPAQTKKPVPVRPAAPVRHHVPPSFSITEQVFTGTRSDPHKNCWSRRLRLNQSLLLWTDAQAVSLLH
ncbi:MAG: hypothetical protein P4M11_12910 [Candidatus Pacebacteria bacterium]|nr:hypothetical protein [Candidatus Paceibacterota bacterium]